MDLIPQKQKIALTAGVLALVLVTALFATAAGARSFVAPVNRCAPIIGGKLVVGKAITSTTGCWSNSPTKYVYQWLRCDTNGSNCLKIAGAASSSYTLTKTDAGNTMIVLVTASNADGQTGPVN